MTARGITPGPWEAVTMRRTVKVGRKWEVVDSWAVFPADPDNAEKPIHTGHILSESDARAIAAVPEMLVALRECVVALTDHVACEAKRASVPVAECCPCDQTTLRTARALLARIDGAK